MKMPSGVYKRKVGWKNETSFKKGVKPWNTGKKLRYKVASAFKKGAIPYNKGKKDPSRSGINHPKWRGGISKLEYWENLAGRKRPDNCEVCGSSDSERKQKLHFDHSHQTGKFRGWICMRCNFTVGLVREVPEVLEKLAEYIRKNK